MCRQLLVILISVLAFLSCNSLKPSNSEKNDPPDAPSNPVPANGAINQEITANITWGWNDVDGDSLSFDVYFDEAEEPALVDSDRRSSWYEPESLEYDHTYYWKVVADDGHGNQTSGPVWHFSTRTLRTFNVLGHYSNSAQGPYLDLTGNIQSNYLYVTNRHSSGTRDSSLILNIADINNVTVAGYIKGALFGNQFGPGYIFSVGRLDSGFKLRAYSLGDAANPNEEFRFDVSNIQDLIVANDYVYLYKNGYAESQPNGLIIVHDMAIVDTLVTQGGVGWGCLRVFGNKLILAEGEVFEIIDISNQASPQILVMAPLPDQCHDAAIAGTTLYIALHTTGVAIADISDLPSTVPLGSIPTVNQSTDILLVYQNYLFVADNNLLIAYNISMPASPYEIARFEAPALITSLNYIQTLLLTYSDGAGTTGIIGLEMQQ